MSNEIIRFETLTGSVELSKDIIKSQLTTNPKVSDTEVSMFINLCKYQKLNPFLKEAYLIKYGDAPAQCIIAYQAFLIRAEMNPNYDGFETDVEYKDKKIFSATTSVFRKDRNRPTKWTVLFSEYSTGKSNWSKMPDFMIRKVSLATALRMAFPSEFQGLYIQEEMDNVNHTIIQNKPTIKKAVEFLESTESEKEKLIARIEKASDIFEKLNQLNVYNLIIENVDNELKNLTENQLKDLLELITETYKNLKKEVSENEK